MIIGKTSVGLNTKYPGTANQKSYQTWHSWRSPAHFYTPMDVRSAVHRYKYVLFTYPLSHLPLTVFFFFFFRPLDDYEEYQMSVNRLFFHRQHGQKIYDPTKSDYFINKFPSFVYTKRDQNEEEHTKWTKS